MSLFMSGLLSAALLPTTHHATWSPAVSAYSPSTGLSTFGIHQAPRTAALSMVEATSAPPGSATAPARAITQWTARAVSLILFAVAMTPTFQFGMVSCGGMVVAPVMVRLPTVSMPPVVTHLLQVAAAATRARLLVLSAMFSQHIAPLLPAVAVPEAVPAALSHPLALHVGRGVASAGAAAVLVCAGPRPAATARAAESSVHAISAVEEEVEAPVVEAPEVEAPVLPPVPTPVPRGSLAGQAARRQAKMIVRGLPAHVSPHKLFDDFPQVPPPHWPPPS